MDVKKWEGIIRMLIAVLSALLGFFSGNVAHAVGLTLIG